MENLNIKEAALNALVESFDLKKLASSLMKDVIKEAIKQAVAKTPNALDDAGFAALWPSIEKELQKLIEEHLDLKKILIKE
jgi:hypothetical protein